MACACPLSHFAPFALSGSHHQVILDVLAAVLAGAVEVETLLQLLLAISRQVEEVHVADGQLLTLWDFPQSSQLDPDRQRGIGRGSGFFSGSDDTCFMVVVYAVWML